MSPSEPLNASHGEHRTRGQQRRGSACAAQQDAGPDRERDADGVQSDWPMLNTITGDTKATMAHDRLHPHTERGAPKPSARASASTPTPMAANAAGIEDQEEAHGLSRGGTQTRHEDDEPVGQRREAGKA